MSEEGLVDGARHLAGDETGGPASARGACNLHDVLCRGSSFAAARSRQLSCPDLQ